MHTSSSDYKHDNYVITSLEITILNATQCSAMKASISLEDVMTSHISSHSSKQKRIVMMISNQHESIIAESIFLFNIMPPLYILYEKSKNISSLLVYNRLCCGMLRNKPWSIYKIDHLWVLRWNGMMRQALLEGQCWHISITAKMRDHYKKKKNKYLQVLQACPACKKKTSLVPLLANDFNYGFVMTNCRSNRDLQFLADIQKEAHSIHGE